MVVRYAEIYSAAPRILRCGMLHQLLSKDVQHKLVTQQATIVVMQLSPK